MKQPFVCIFGGDFSEAQIKVLAETTTPFFYPQDAPVKQTLRVCQPDVIATIGGVFSDYKELCAESLKVRQKWLHFADSNDLMRKLAQLYYCFVDHAIKFHNEESMVSLFTTSYKSKDFILRPFRTLLNQTYPNWEWVIVDDTDGDENWENLKKIKNQDPRIRIYRSDKNSGIIGNVKNIASSLCRGGFLIELDHDDELSDDAVQKTYEAFQEFPDAGFAYTDFVELFEDQRNFNYSELCCVGYGAYRKVWQRGRWRSVCACSPINPVTIRYIVAAPNHIRAWRKTVFNQIGGWNNRLHVADDYEIVVRSFLASKMVRIPHLCYYQYRNEGGNNFTFIRNAEIQKLVKVISSCYNEKIHKRCMELNIPDPYYLNWDHWPQFGKAWFNPKYDPVINYVSGRNPLTVSIIMLCDENTDAHLLQSNVGQALTQVYPVKEIYVIGVKAGAYLESAMMPFGGGAPVYWWNLDEGTPSEAKNYACKMLVDGNFICYWDVVDEMYDDLYVSKMVSDFGFGGISWSKNRKMHLASVFKEIGQYWKRGEDLYDAWTKFHEKKDRMVVRKNDGKGVKSGLGIGLDNVDTEPIVVEKPIDLISKSGVEKTEIQKSVADEEEDRLKGVAVIRIEIEESDKGVVVREIENEVQKKKKNLDSRTSMTTSYKCCDCQHCCHCCDGKCCDKCDWTWEKYVNCMNNGEKTEENTGI